MQVYGAIPEMYTSIDFKWFWKHSKTTQEVLHVYVFHTAFIVFLILYLGLNTNKAKKAEMSHSIENNALTLIVSGSIGSAA